MTITDSIAGTIIGTGSSDSTRTLPPDRVLEQFRGRARRADAENEYIHEDLAVLREIGYLAAAVPAEFGGWGLNLAEFAVLQRRLATYTPATALAMTMHTYWIGIAAELERYGDTSCRWMFDEALAGTVIAAGHAEAGNDAPVIMSTTARGASTVATASRAARCSVRTVRSGRSSVRTASTCPIPQRSDDRPRLRRP